MGWEFSRKWLEHGRLELSTEPTSAAEQFHLMFLLKVEERDGGVQVANAAVVRDGAKVAVTCRNGETLRGLPLRAIQRLLPDNRKKS